jgi:serine/threonine-protein kinase 24/25/MST4
MSKRLPGYTIGDEIGSGAYGRIFEARRDSDGAVFAVKRISLSGLSEQAEADILREGEILSRLHHPGIIFFVASHYDRPSLTLHIVTELCPGGNLEEHVSRMPGRRLTSSNFPALARALLQPLHYLHATGIIHRDLKVCESNKRLPVAIHVRRVSFAYATTHLQPANILLAADGTPKITDFGVSRSLTATMSRRLTGVGTLHFMAPEVAVHTDDDAEVVFDAYTVTADIWSFGVTW